MDEKKLEFRTGLAVVIGLVILAAMIIFAGGLNFLRDYYVVKANFKSAGGLKKGAPVRMAGVEIGKVKSIQFMKSSDETTFIEMEMEIDRGYKINTDATIAITSDSLLGERLLEITPGENNAYLQPNETLGKFGTTPGTIEDALKLVPDIVASASKALDNINQIISDPTVQNDVRRSISGLSEAANNAESLLIELRAIVTENKEDIRKTVNNFAETSAETREFVVKLKEIETQVSETITSVKTELLSFAKKINDPDVFAKVNSALTKFDKLPDSLTEFLESLRKIANDDVAGIVTKTDKFIEDLQATMVQVRQDLKEIADSAKATLALTRNGDGLIAALLTDRSMTEKLDDMLDQGVYLLEHPIMFILKGGYDKRKDPPEKPDEDAEKVDTKKENTKNKKDEPKRKPSVKSGDK